MSTFDKILTLTRQLYPEGLAFRMPKDGNLEALHLALAVSEAEWWNDAVSILDSILPDTDRFTADDATDWERRLGIAASTSTSLTDRKAAILRKLQAPGRNPAKANYLYLQQQLQLAGFNVFVYENLVPAYPDTYTYMNPAVVNPAILSQSQHGDHQHGDVQSHHINHVVANSIENAVDINFNIGNSFACTFFIGGSPLGTYASVPASRETEFRQLILRLKPVQNVAFLFINYV